ncbi:MAG: peptide deformylase [Clostridiales bacterium]|jgi:peptide deformylase|nr:peptide deformylase [Clostridiales bacterium]
MAIRSVVKIGDEILRKKSKEVVEFDFKLADLLDDMVETMRKADGAGLAAPQVGILKRVVVIDVGQGIVELVNPKILKTAGAVSEIEGCLSVPNKKGYVIRPKSVKLEAFDRCGNKCIIKGEDLFARAICHEIDHLDGILYVDKLEEGRPLMNEK